MLCITLWQTPQHKALHADGCTMFVYGLPAGYPAIEIPACSALAEGTGDPEADAKAEAAHSPKSALVWARPTGDWDLIHGELVSFTDAAVLTALDQVEGFNAGGYSLYQRSLHVEGKQELAWDGYNPKNLVITGLSALQP